MNESTLNLRQLADMLRQDARDVEKMASRGHLPARRVGGEWTFAAAEIHLWLEKKLPEYNDEELSRFDSSEGPAGDLLLCPLLAQDSIELDLHVKTRSSLMQEIVKIAERSWQVWDPQTLLASLKEREQRSSTALPGGVAMPHPARRLPDALGESVVAFARLAEPLNLGAPDNSATDLVFLVACRGDSTHLQVLARLSRLIMREDLVAGLRAAPSPRDAWHLLEEAERALLANPQ